MFFFNFLRKLFKSFILFGVWILLVYPGLYFIYLIVQSVKSLSPNYHDNNFENPEQFYLKSLKLWYTWTFGLPIVIFVANNEKYFFIWVFLMVLCLIPSIPRYFVGKSNHS